MRENFFHPGQHTTVLFLSPETHERVTDLTRLHYALVKAAGGEVYEGEFQALETGWYTMDGKPLTAIYNCSSEYPEVQKFKVSDKMGRDELPISLQEFTEDVALRIITIEAPTDPATVYRRSPGRRGFHFPSFAYVTLRSLKTYQETLAFHEMS